MSTSNHEKISKTVPPTTKLPNSNYPFASTTTSKESNPTNPLSNERQKSPTSNICQSLSSDKRQNRTQLKLKKRHPVLTNIRKQKKNRPQQHGLQTFGFKYTSNNRTKLTQQQQNNSIQTSIDNTTTLTKNTHKGDKLTKLNPNPFRLFYITLIEQTLGEGITP